MPTFSLNHTISDTEVWALQRTAQQNGVTVADLLRKVLRDYTARSAEDFETDLHSRLRAALLIATPIEKEALIDMIVAIENP